MELVACNKLWPTCNMSHATCNMFTYKSLNCLHVCAFFFFCFFLLSYVYFKAMNMLFYHYSKRTLTFSEILENDMPAIFNGSTRPKRPKPTNATKNAAVCPWLDLREQHRHQLALSPTLTFLENPSFITSIYGPAGHRRVSQSLERQQLALQLFALTLVCLS